jgi:hypothetical protein
LSSAPWAFPSALSSFSASLKITRKEKWGDGSWSILYMLPKKVPEQILTIAVVQTAPEFFVALEFPLFYADHLVGVMLSDHNLIMGVISQIFSGRLKLISMEKFSVLMKIYLGTMGLHILYMVSDTS